MEKIQSCSRWRGTSIAATLGESAAGAGESRTATRRSWPEIGFGKVNVMKRDGIRVSNVVLSMAIGKHQTAW